MFLQKKSEINKRRTQDISQFGLTEIPDDFDPTGSFVDMEGSDSDLEAELAAIASGKSKAPVRKKDYKREEKNDLDKMVAESLKDIASDDEDDADLENDNDLLGELQQIVGRDECSNPAAANIANENEGDIPQDQHENIVSTTSAEIMQIIQQRIETYRFAETKSKNTGESAKARRFARGLKTLLEMQKLVNTGKDINVDDIPPQINVKPVENLEENVLPSVPSRSAPPPAPSIDSLSETKSLEDATPHKIKNSTLGQLLQRQKEYKTAALHAKRNGDTGVAIQFIKVVKQFDMVIKMIEDNQKVDLSDMPPPPDQFLAFMKKLQEGAEENQNDINTVAQPHEEPKSEDDISIPLPMQDALQQRLDKYKSVQETAEAEGNSSKARRFGRIVKQYEEAIKQYKAGLPVAYDDLPVPPGFGPLPNENSKAGSSNTPSTTVIAKHSNLREDGKNLNQLPSEIQSASAPSRVSPQKLDLTTRTSGNQQKNNLAEQQMKILLERQAEFKVAAIEAKKAGEINQAKEYLKIYKGFDALLNAASSGLPVDLTTLPLPPSQRDDLEASFAIVSTEECNTDDDISDIAIRIEEQLAKQLMMCKNTRDHHKAMGDVAGMNRFENLALTVQKDLDLVRYLKHKNHSLPKFHYEKRSFNIVHCNTELSENELEIIVVRGLNYNVPNPKDVDTYVKIEFPLLNDDTFKVKTSVIKNNDSPDYEEHFRVEIQRGNRQFHRIFKRHSVKFEVYSRGGFLRSDTLIGTVNVKLQPLETKCDVHDTFNLMDGRKAVGGKLEVKLRVRNPILTKQMEHIEEKWLVLDA
uniref:Coiled-coil and C2 domain-containing protein 1-like n=1 Tax=Ceratitis capitata TaxID=7213 RepID=W8C0K5_CERCA